MITTVLVVALSVAAGAALTEQTEQPIADHAHHAAMAGHQVAVSKPVTHAPMSGTPLDFFTNYGRYMPRTHCLVGADGRPDWPWIIGLVVFTAIVIAGYLRIFVFWRRAYLDEAPQDRNKKMMQLAYIFLFCAICGYGFALMMYVWPAYRLLACFMVVLMVVTWKFAFSLKDFRISLSAHRLRRELEEGLRDRNSSLERLVAERTKDLEQVREQTRQLALVAAKTSNAVIITDATGRVTWVNRSFTRITGYSLEEVVGKKPGAVLQGPDTDPDTIAKLRDALRKKEPVRTQILNYAKDGRPYWLDLEIQPIREDDGEVTHFMAIETDITESKALQTELSRAKEQAELANEAKSRFLANISHEIRTPLTGIIGFAQMLEEADEVYEAQRRDWARTIHTSSVHLQMLLNDVLDISKIEAGKLDLERMPVALHPLLADIASIFRVSAADKGLSFELVCPNPLPQTVTVDPTRLRQVICNLASNAIKFTQQGSVRVEADVVDGLLRIDVIDTGPGISEEALKKLFQPFTQADASVTRKHGGTGLGLVIAKQLCEAMGGGMRIESRVGFGSRFIATFDPGDLTGASMVVANEVAIDSSSSTCTPQPAPSRTPRDVDDTRPLTGRCILVVDDGDTNRKLIKLMLNRAGAEVVEAVNGREGLNRITTESTRIDLVLMDMQMPEMDGYEATRGARQAGFDRPIIALTASAMRGDRERCIEAGCTSYLTKPINSDTLFSTITQLLDDNERDGLDPADGDPELAALVEVYLRDLGGYLQEAREALTHCDTAMVARLAHKVRGSGGTFGFDQLTEPASQLEAAALDGAIEQATVCLATLERLHRSILAQRPARKTTT